MKNRKVLWAITLTLAIAVLSAHQAAAQESPTYTSYLKPELFVSAGGGVAGQWLSECCPPTWKNLGIGLNVRLSRRFGVELEGNRMLGAEPARITATRLRADGTPGARFEYREGISSMTLASGNILYYFSDRRIQPYVSAGIGGIWERGIFYSSTRVEEAYRHNDVAGTAGAGLRLSITPRISVRPEFRVYATSRTRVETVGRAAIAVVTSGEELRGRIQRRDSTIVANIPRLRIQGFRACSNPRHNPKLQPGVRLRIETPPETR
jgi:opacity protein-like surface antigen